MRRMAHMSDASIMSRARHVSAASLAGGDVDKYAFSIAILNAFKITISTPVHI
jgi:hypothetical protein